MDIFDKWNDTKKTIHHKPKQKMTIKEGGVYWVNIGQNVGCEVNGKGGVFSRPVLVLKRVYIINTPYDFFIGVPLTSKNKSGFLHHKITNKKDSSKVTAMLGQIRMYDAKRVIKYHYMADKNEFEEVRGKVVKLISPGS